MTKANVVFLQLHGTLCPGILFSRAVIPSHILTYDLTKETFKPSDSDVFRTLSLMASAKRCVNRLLVTDCHYI